MVRGECDHLQVLLLPCGVVLTCMQALSLMLFDIRYQAVAGQQTTSSPKEHVTLPPLLIDLSIYLDHILL